MNSSKHGGPRRFRIGVDVGGTFTDVVLVEEATGEILAAKVATVPADPSQGCIDGVDKALTAFAIDPAEIVLTVHGTTIATNTIIEGKGAKAGLVTSAGFRDVLEIAYQTRPDLYDLLYEKPRPLIPRYLCLGVPARIGPAGEEIVPLDEAALREAAGQFRDAGVEAIAVAFLHSYLNPAHEQRAAAILAEECPDTPIVLSSNICPEYREYPRTSTTVVNAVLVPRVAPYLERLENRLTDRGIGRGLHLMTSAGGIMAAATTRQQPVHLIESGPAGGVIGATFVAGLSGYDNLLALDIGGTTAKAALVNDGRPQIADEFEVGAAAVATVTGARGRGYPVRAPVISLLEIGAGGGSIANVDPGGALTVGPQSAGADPGPACYGKGGMEPTLTDANLVLGRINPDFFLGGEVALDRALSEQAMREAVAEPMGLNLIDAACSVIDIANARMTSALYFVTVQRGIDPRDYVLVPSGGAGPMQAVDIARSLGVRTVLIPPKPGVNSAVGLLATDLMHEIVRTFMRRADEADPAALAQVFAEMEAANGALLRGEDVPDDQVEIRREIDMCYFGQSFQLRIPFAGDIDATTAATVTAAFHDRHEEAYGFCDRREPTMFINLRATAVGKVKRPQLRALAAAEDPVDRALKGRRKVCFSAAGGMADCAIYDREKLLFGDRFAGPAIVEQMDTTTVVPPGATIAVDRYGSLVISVGTAQDD